MGGGFIFFWGGGGGSNVISRDRNVLDGHRRPNDAIDASHYRKKRRGSSVNLVVELCEPSWELDRVIGRMQPSRQKKIP